VYTDTISPEVCDIFPNSDGTYTVLVNIPKIYDEVNTEQLISKGIWLYTLTNRGSTLQGQAFSANFVDEITGVSAQSSIANVKPGIVGSLNEFTVTARTLNSLDWGEGGNWMVKVEAVPLSELEQPRNGPGDAETDGVTPTMALCQDQPLGSGRGLSLLHGGGSPAVRHSPAAAPPVPLRSWPKSLRPQSCESSRGSHGRSCSVLAGEPGWKCTSRYITNLRNSVQRSSQQNRSGNDACLSPNCRARRIHFMSRESKA
jgi:hypothetical protein